MRNRSIVRAIRPISSVALSSQYVRWITHGAGGDGNDSINFDPRSEITSIGGNTWSDLSGGVAASWSTRLGWVTGTNNEFFVESGNTRLSQLLAIAGCTGGFLVAFEWYAPSVNASSLARIAQYKNNTTDGAWAIQIASGSQVVQMFWKDANNNNTDPLISGITDVCSASRRHIAFYLDIANLEATLYVDGEEEISAAIPEDLPAYDEASQMSWMANASGSAQIADAFSNPAIRDPIIIRFNSDVSADIGRIVSALNKFAPDLPRELNGV